VRDVDVRCHGTVVLVLDDVQRIKHGAGEPHLVLYRQLVSS
jgi:hypothetical protein